MEKSYIKKIDLGYLKNRGFKISQINNIYDLVNRGIDEHLYTKTKILYHDIKHIERVLIYCTWILNEKLKKGEKIENEDILFLAALYHDTGKTVGANNKNHGFVGADITKDKLQGKLDNKTINTICELIKTHAVDDDNVYLNDFDYSEEEKKNIRILSDILKDADALDRNRLKIYPFDRCKIKFLRTNEAKEIFSETNLLLKKYNEARKR